MRGLLACLLVLAALVGAPVAGHAGVHEAGTPAACSAAFGAGCGERRAPLNAGDRPCPQEHGADQHCCADPQCLSGHGGLLPRSAIVPDFSTVAALRSRSVDRLDGAEPAPGVRPPRPGA